MAMNIDLKNLNMSDIQDQIKKLMANKKLVTKIGIIFGAIVFFLIIYYAVLNPMVNSRKAKLDDMNKKKQETEQFTKDINSMKAKIKKLKPEYENYSKLFHSKAEVEGLYQTLSVFAGRNDLVISKIVKKPIESVLKSQALAKASGKKAKKSKKGKKNQTKSVKNIAYYKIPVEFEINGNFIGYIKFKRALSLSNKMLNFDKESIQVVKGDSTGTIKVNGSLTIVGLPDEFFKLIFLALLLMLAAKVSMADSHDAEQNIIDKAKEINQNIKKKQSNQQANISSEIGNNEEPLPLNDPFVGDSSLTGGALIEADPEEAKNEMSLYKFKLVGVMTSEKNGGFVSLVNASGDIITVSLFEELSPGVKLVAINNKEAVFEKNSESLMVINFKNQITERSF